MSPSTKPRLAIVTCGPASIPLDEVRRITNFSSGELGAILCDALLNAGWHVLCFRGESATVPCPARQNLTLSSFSTNADLLAQLRKTADQTIPDVFFHAAALSDYELDSLQTADGQALAQRKIPGSLPLIRIVLRPAAKVLAQLPKLFPATRIVGWKYELEGDRVDAEKQARRQIEQNQSALCILNGSAYGNGFGVVHPNGHLVHADSKATLARTLCEWAG